MEKFSTSSLLRAYELTAPRGQCSKALIAPSNKAEVLHESRLYLSY